jgi:hypothetical protein
MKKIALQLLVAAPHSDDNPQIRLQFAAFCNISVAAGSRFGLNLGRVVDEASACLRDSGLRECIGSELLKQVRRP